MTSYQLFVSAPGAVPTQNIPVSMEMIRSVCRQEVSLEPWKEKQNSGCWMACAPLSTQTPITPGVVVQALKARTTRQQEPCDINLVSSELLDFQPKLFLMDVDSTMIKQETIDELGKKMGVGEKISSVTEQAMKGKLNFEAALLERLVYFIGLREENFLGVLPSLEPQDGLQDLITWAHQRQMYVACVSGGFNLIVKRLAEQFGLDGYYAHELEFNSGRFTGKVVGPVVDGKEKVKYLSQLCRKLSLTPQDAVVIGDGANDCAMVRKARVGIGFKPKPKLAQEVQLVLHASSLNAIPLFFEKW